MRKSYTETSEKSASDSLPERKEAVETREAKPANEVIESEEWSAGGGDEMEAVVRDFTPLVRKTAARYEGRGAEREDLIQEGYLALLTIVRRYNKNKLSTALAINLPGLVRNAAARLRRARAMESVSLSGDEDADNPDAREFQIPDDRS
jgi:DNA-directed RNA polymerase specialized sigma subunit